jgi:hypothetical protein
MLGHVHALEAQAESRLDCCIVGAQSTLRAEVLDTVIGLETVEGQIVKGTMQELLHVRSFAGAGGVYHSDALSLSGASTSTIWADPPGLALFDGATSLLKCGQRWPNVARIVLLEKGDARSNDAAAEINREFVQRVEAPPMDLPRLAHPGCEVISYEARPA